jgi:hypothetical protein
MAGATYSVLLTKHYSGDKVKQRGKSGSNEMYWQRFTEGFGG